MPKKYDEVKQQRMQIHTMSTVIWAYTAYFQKMLGCFAGDGNQTKRKWTKGHHPFIPSHSTREVISTLKMVREHMIAKRDRDRFHVLKLLDCGCGVGNILLMARALGGYSLTGLEYDPRVCKIARILIMDAEIIRQNILTYKHYAQHDVIYYYQPISDNTKMCRFAKKVNNDIKVGTVVISL